MIRMLDDDELASLAGSETGFGALETEKGCLPLVALDLDVKIDGLAAHGTVSQCFRNGFADPLEATYVFPLPPRAAVIGFRMIVDGAVIEGRIDERAKARADYDAAIARGQSAAIAEEERADVFTIRVGNIPARSLARVEFTLVEPLSIDSLEATYRFPLVVSPRYCPGTAVDGDPTGDGILPDTDLVPDASRISPPVLLPGFPNPVRLGIRIAMGGPVPLAEDLAASLPVKLIQGHDTLQMVVEPGQRLDRDFVLRWPLGLGSVPKATFAIEPDATRPVGMGRKEGSVEAPGDGTFSLVVFPPKVAAQSRPPRDVVFLLDRSGSMSGWQIAAARRAIARTLDTLSSDDRLAVLAFDNTVETHSDSPTLIPATDRNRWATLEWLGTIEARGGTEMEAALKEGLALLKRRKKKANPKPVANEAPTRDPILILVTDGQIGDEDRVLTRLEKSLGATTLHVVGIDTAANAGLLSRLADSSGGTHDIVESEDRLDEVMDRIQERLVAPIVTDVRLEGEGVEILDDSVVPAKRPNLFPGVPLVLRGRVQGTGPGRVTIRGKKQGGGTWRVDVTPHLTGAPGLGALWARGRLQQLTDAYAVGDDGDSEAIERRVVALSTGFGVLCRFTAVVAIDPRMPEKPIDGATLRQIVQPVDAFPTLACSSLLKRPSFHWLGVSPSRASVFRDSAGGVADYALELPSGSHADACIGWATDGLADLAATPLDRPAEQAMIREALALLRPRSGRLADVPAEMLTLLFGEVSKVLAMLQADRSISPLKEALERSFESFKKHPADRDALLQLLEILADFSEPVDRWWRAENEKPAVVF
jgi:Ca-activated chloride channel family protein